MLSTEGDHICKEEDSVPPQSQELHDWDRLQQGDTGKQTKMDVFGGAPRFLAYPRTVVVQSGNDAVLKCQIGGDPRPTVIWERNNKQIWPQGRCRLFQEGNIYNLIISSVSAEDSGQYICKAKNSIGETYAAATLKVEGEAQKRELREENKPRFLIKPLSTRVGRGEDAVFSCKLWGNPRPEVVWEKDGKKLSEIFESTHFSMSYQDGGWFQLKILKTRAPDGGVYTCKARNEFGEELAGAVLLVDAGPGHDEEGTRNGYSNAQWKSHQSKQRNSRQVVMRQKEEPLPNSAIVKMFAVTEGKHAKFRCFVTGKPKPEILWRKDGRLILSGRRYLLYEDREGYFTLKVLYCKQQDNGVYVCAASNTAGQTLSAVHLTVKEPPVRFKQPLCDLEVWERDLAILECEVPEDSVPTTWYLEDRRLQPGVKYDMEEWGTKRRLTIRDIGADDDGIYLCEMADGGRSIAEVSVRGTIVRKLPRKVDVLEGENAAFCVEVEEEEMDIHWYNDGVELRETHQTIIKSFGKTHILVFVNSSPHDSGIVTFIVGRSKTSTQLRVKAARHCPPSCPVGVQINLERANAALLSWGPAHDSRRNRPLGYVLERQEVGTQEWLQCLTTDSATSVEILGDSVPCEADYRFRIYSVNKYGKSGQLEFPRAAHLVPVAKIQTPLQDALVPEGQDACFTIDLTASVIGTWFLNGTQVQEDDRFSMRRSRTHHFLRIRGVRDTDNGAEITFIAYGIRDSAALYLQEPLVKFTPLSEMDRNKFVEFGNPIVLYCEISDPAAPVHWYKNGVELCTEENLHIQSEGTMRRIVIQSADFCHSGVYRCDAVDDVIRFNVEVEAPPVRFSAVTEAERNLSVEEGCPILLQCEVSDPRAQISWYKDGILLNPETGTHFQLDGRKRILFIESANLSHTGVYSCETKADVIKFKVDVKETRVKLTTDHEVEKNKSVEAGSPIVLQCELSDPNTLACWYKDGILLCPQSGFDIKSQGSLRTLTVQSSEPSQSGLYRCVPVDVEVEFHVDVKDTSLRFSELPEAERNKSVEAGCPLLLQCELSNPNAVVWWDKDGTDLFSKPGQEIQSEGCLRRLIIPSTEQSHSGVYRCKSSDDVVAFTVNIEASSVEFSSIPEKEQLKPIETDIPTELQCEHSKASTHFYLYNDESELHPKQNLDKQTNNSVKTLIVPNSELSDSAVYSCQTNHDAVILEEITEELPHSWVYSCAMSDDSAQSNKDIQVAEVKEKTSVEAAQPVVPQCELTEPREQVCWYKDDTELHPQSGQDIQSYMVKQTQTLQSTEHCNSGVYSCKAANDDAILYKKDAEAPSEINSTFYEENFELTEEELPSVKQSEQSEGKSHACTHKEERKPVLRPGDRSDQPDSVLRNRRTSQAEVQANWREHNIEIHDESFTLKVDVKDSALRLKATPGVERHKYVNTDGIGILECELLDHNAEVNWYKDGNQLHSESGQHIESESAIKTLTVPSAEILHTGLYACETMDDITAGPLRFLSNMEAQKTKLIGAGCPVVLHCELTDASARVHWYKDDIELQQHSNLDIQSEGTVRRLLINSAEPSHSGTYKCDAVDDVILFKVEIQAPPVGFSTVSEAEKSKTVQAGSPIVLQCELTCPSAHVSWSKDGTELQPQSGLDIQSENATRTLIILSADTSHSGVYSCNTKDDSIQFFVDIKDISVHNAAQVILDATETVLPLEVLDVAEEEKRFTNKEQCELFNPSSLLSCYNEESQEQPQNENNIRFEDKESIQFVKSTKLKSIWKKECKKTEPFNVETQVPSLSFVELPAVERNKSVEPGNPIVLQCELSDPSSNVRWYKDGAELHPQSGLDMQSEEATRTLIILSAESDHSGVYSCKTKGDAIHFCVDIKGEYLDLCCAETYKTSFSNTATMAPSMKEDKTSSEEGCYMGQQSQPSEPCVQVYKYTKGTEPNTATGTDIQSEDPAVKFTKLPEVERHKCVEAGCPVVLLCELSDPNAPVRWCKDDTELYPKNGLHIQSEGARRRLLIQSAQLEDSGIYSCDAADDIIVFSVDIQAPQIKFSEVTEAEKVKVVQAGSPIILQCELSDPKAQVCWYKDGSQIHLQPGTDIHCEGKIRTMCIKSATLSHAGIYTCETIGDAITFKVDIEAPPSPVRFSAVPEIEKSKSIEAGHPIVLQCELSDATVEVCWYKDGVPLQPKNGIYMQSEGNKRTLVYQSAEFSCSGVYSCKTADDISEFYVDVKASPVTFVEVPEENLHRSVVQLDTLVLSCEISRHDGLTQWYKDGVELQPDSNIGIQAEGTLRKLIIASTQLTDSGTYSCRAGDNALLFQVNIREPPLKIVYPKEDVHLDRHVPEEVVLSCELSRPNGVVHWYRDGQRLQESENIKLKSEGPYRRLKILHCNIEDSGEYVCDTADDSIFFQLSVTEAPVRIISPSQSQMELCQQTSEQMILSCEISRPNASVRWYRDGLEIEENENLILEVDGVYRRLIIPQTTVQDSAEYVCDTVDDSVTFIVNIAEPPVRFVRPRKMASIVEGFAGDTLVLECEVSRPNAQVCWKKNGEEIGDSRNITVIEDGILRHLTIHSLTLMDNGKYTCDAKDDVMDFQVNVSEKPIKILKKAGIKTEFNSLVSDDIVLECEISSPKGIATWCKDGAEIAENERIYFKQEGVFHSLVITSCVLTDSGKYICDIEDGLDNMIFNVNVEEYPVNILGNSGSPEQHTLSAGDDLILECEVSRANAEVDWYCNGSLLSADSRTHIESHGTYRKLVLSKLRPSDSGIYTCDAIDDKMVTMLKVEEPTVKVLNKGDSGVVTALESESVTFSTKVHQQNATVHWLKEGKSVSGGRFRVSREGNNHFLTITDLLTTDSGNYECKANNNHVHFKLWVKGMRVKFVQPLENMIAQKDGAATLRCELNQAKGDVQWFKDGHGISPSCRFVIRAYGCERSLTIHNLTVNDGGHYACESTHDRTTATVIVKKLPIVEFIAEISNTTVIEGEDAAFKCMLSLEDVQLVWHKDGCPIGTDGRFVPCKNGLCHTLHIHKCQLSDSCKITAVAEGKVSKATLHVKESQVVFTKKLKPMVCEEYGDVTLEVEVSVACGEVQWMRQGVLIQPGHGRKFTLKESGKKRSLTLHKVSVSERGCYRCETLHDYTQSELSVEPRRITIRKGLFPLDAFERETATFEVELSQTNIEGVWQKDGISLKPNNHFDMSAKGHIHRLTISNLTVEDNGTVTFAAQSAKTSARLTVKEIPVVFLRKTEDLSITEGALVSIECELSRQNIDVKWLKNGSEVTNGKNIRIYSMGKKRFLQILKCDIGDTGVYTCDAGETHTSCALDVYERQVYVVNGLENVDIQEGQNAVFTCEVSIEDVPGEWYKKGERILTSSTIKMHQEGTKHFLLICNVKADDSGKIMFVARQVESVAYLHVEELPKKIVKPLEDTSAVENEKVILHCTVSNPRCSIRWYHGKNVILPSEHFEICSEGCIRKLVIQQVSLHDDGMYSVQVGENISSARLTVDAQSPPIVRCLEDVHVEAPEEACFECETSGPFPGAPVWTLNGEILHVGSDVQLESCDGVHRLTFTQTSEDMSGVVVFNVGNAKSSAKLHIRRYFMR